MPGVWREKGGLVAAGWRCQSVRLEPPALGRPQAVEGCPTKVCVPVEMGREAAAEPGTFLLSPAQSVRDSSCPSAQASVYPSLPV